MAFMICRRVLGTKDTLTNQSFPLYQPRLYLNVAQGFTLVGPSLILGLRLRERQGKQPHELLEACSLLRFRVIYTNARLGCFNRALCASTV